MAYHHRKQSRHIAFATRRNTFLIEKSKGEATGVADRGEEVEAAEGDGIQIMARDDALESSVDFESSDEIVAWTGLEPFACIDRLVTFAYFSEQFLHIYLLCFDAEFLTDDIAVE